MQVLGALAEMRGTGAVLLFHAESEVEEEEGADREAMGQLGECEKTPHDISLIAKP